MEIIGVLELVLSIYLLITKKLHIYDAFLVFIAMNNQKCIEFFFITYSNYTFNNQHK